MADSSVALQDATASTINFDTFTMPGGDHRQAVVIGDASAVTTAPVTADGLKVVRARAATAVTTSVGGSASSVTLKAANANRLALEIRNDSTAALYVEYGATATTASIKKLFPGEVFREEIYTGIVTGIWESATGNARVMELTA